MNDRPLDSLEAAVIAAAREFQYPETPDLAAAAGARLRPRQRPRPAPTGALRKLIPAAVLLILVLAAFLSIPPVRAQVRQFLQIGLVRIFLREQTPAITPTVSATPAESSQSGNNLSVFELMGQTSLEEARSNVDFPIRLPAYPNDLGPPARVYLQDMGGPVVILVWNDPADPQRVRLSLHLISPGSFAIEKWNPVTVEETQVDGQPAVWATGPYPLRLIGKDIEFSRLIAGHVLVWEADGLTYRLETDLTLEQALQIAESLE